jgi:hypothetical protein
MLVIIVYIILYPNETKLNYNQWIEFIFEIKRKKNTEIIPFR